MRTLEDDLWIYFGYPNEYWRKKCAACREKVLKLKTPVPECIDCWKVEIWSQSSWFQGAETGVHSGGADGLTHLYLLAFELAARYGVSFVAKISKYPIQVVRTGEPPGQYPDVKTDCLLMIYATSVQEREHIRQDICRVLGLDPAAAINIPVRRGCWLYDPILGPWQTWELR